MKSFKNSFYCSYYITLPLFLTSLLTEKKYFRFVPEQDGKYAENVLEYGMK